MYLGIDPGVNNTGVIILDRKGKVVDALLIERYKNELLPDNLEMQVFRLSEFLIPHMEGLKASCIEMPVIYPDQPYRQNDILDLGVMAGALTSVFCGCSKVLMPTPPKWKGQTPKAIHNKRILKRVKNLDTFLCGYKKTKHEHLIDAAGLALYAINKERL